MQTAHLLTLSDRARAAFVAATAGLLVLGATLPGAAMADQVSTTQSTAATQQSEAIGPHTHQLHGTVKTVSGSTFVVTTDRYGDVSVSFAGAASNGHGHGHGRGSGAAHTQVASAADIKPGDRVIVQGSTSTSDPKTFNARRVHVLPGADAGQHAANHLVGTITSASTTNGTTTLTVKLTDGTSQSVTVSSASKIRPAGKTTADLTVGTKVTVVEKDGAATGVVVMPA